MLDSQMKKILICAVPFSDNLGDGVIAASLAHIAGLKYPQARVEFLDIAGRLGFEEETCAAAAHSGSLRSCLRSSGR